MFSSFSHVCLPYVCVCVFCFLRALILVEPFFENCSLVGEATGPRSLQEAIESDDFDVDVKLDLAVLGSQGVGKTSPLAESMTACLVSARFFFV